MMLEAALDVSLRCQCSLTKTELSHFKKKVWNKEAVGLTTVLMFKSSLLKVLQ